MGDECVAGLLNGRLEMRQNEVEVSFYCIEHEEISHERMEQGWSAVEANNKRRSLLPMKHE